MTSSVRAEAELANAAGEPGARRPDVQGLRALAVLAVMGYHAGLPIPGGFAGVDVFFVLSGYLISSQLWARCSLGAVRLWAFWAARIRRLLPAAMMLGSAYLLVVDMLARSVAAIEVPLGILTATVGAPFFLWLLIAGKRGWS